MTTAGSAVVPPSTFTIFPAGTPITGTQAGDLVLVRHGSLMAKLIRFGQRIRYRGDLRPFAWCNHAAIVVSPGQLIEQQGRGGTQVSLDEYVFEDVAVVRLELTPAEQVDVAAFAHWTLGLGYSWLTVAGIVVDLLTGWRLSIGSGLRLICSAAASKALEHGGTFIPDRMSESILPADLARLFEVTLPE